MMNRCAAVKLVLGASLFLDGTVLSAQPQAQSSFENQLRRAVTVKGQPVETFRLADRMGHYKVPGLSVAVIEGCKLAEVRGFGVATAGGPPVEADTRFQAASISKPVAALAALRLVEQGKLALDADVRTTLKGWNLPASDVLGGGTVTLRGLLSHGAGLTVHGFGGYPAGDPLPTIQQILDGKPPANSDPVRIEAAPGSKWKYSGGGYTVAQLLMTEAASMPFPSLMRDLVLAPAKMSSSTYEQPLPKVLAGKAAVAHLATGEAVPTKWHVYPEMAAAGLWTTAADLAGFAVEIVRAERGEAGALLSPTMTKEMLTRQIGSWGLGFELSAEGKPRSFSHGGANKGFRSFLIMYPDSCQGAAVMINSDNGGLRDEVLRAIASTYSWPDPMPSLEREMVATTPAVIARLLGTYQLKEAPSYRFRIRTDPKGELALIGPDGAPSKLLAASTTHLFSPDTGLELRIDSAGSNPFAVKMSVSNQSYLAARTGN